MDGIMPIIGFGEWNITNLRLTTFYNGNPVSAGLWKKLTGEPPESSETREREGVIQEQGIVESGNILYLGIQSNRLDWNFHPGPAQSNTGGAPTAIPLLLAIEHAMPILQRALSVSINACGRVDRIAFGSILVKQETDQAESMRWLARHLPHLSLEDHDGEGFALQVNRRRRSARVPHVRINRIARWQQEISVGVRGTIAVDSGVPQSNVEMHSRSFINRLTLDINTVLGGSAVSSDRWSGLFDEFVDLAQEIAIKGDIP